MQPPHKTTAALATHAQDTAYLTNKVNLAPAWVDVTKCNTLWN